jgi:hypothetical protein
VAVKLGLEKELFTYQQYKICFWVVMIE